jgi:hypothetical protein
MADKGKTQLQLKEELLWGMSAFGYAGWLGVYLQSLPQYVDDAQRDFGFDIYERMLKDPAVFSSMQTIKIGILSQGARFIAPADALPSFRDDPEAQARYERAEEIRSFIESICMNLQQPLEDILGEMLDALSFGYSVAEKTYEARGSKLVLKSLKPKPRRNFAFAVDRYTNLAGLVGTTDKSSGLMPSLLSNVDEESVIPRDKFMILTHAGKGCDPRGSSILRIAYNAWYLKQQVWPFYLKYLAQFGSPSLVGKTPEDAADIEVVDAQGNVVKNDDGTPQVLTAEQAMLQQLLAFSNGTAIVLPHGSEFDTVESQGDGSAFTNAIDVLDRQIARAILIAIRATMEAQHGSKADSETSQDILADYTKMIQRSLEVAFYRDVIYPTVVMNFGQEAADDVCPYMSLSNVAREDIVETGNMIANLARANVVHPSQYPGIDAMLNLPERDFESQMEEMAADKDQAAMLQGLLAGAGDNAVNQSDGE